jgi:hypothetical protein
MVAAHDSYIVGYVPIYSDGGSTLQSTYDYTWDVVVLKHLYRLCKVFKESFTHGEA